MFQTILIISPMIVVFVVSSVFIFLGLRRYRLRKEQKREELDGHTLGFIILGSIGLPVSIDIILLIFTHSKIIFPASLLIGIILFLTGELTLRKLIIAGKEYILPVAITIFGATAVFFGFPLMINIREPFTAFYSFIVVIVTVIGSIVHMDLIKSWKRTVIK